MIYFTALNRLFRTNGFLDLDMSQRKID